jgi:hypothetical protein
MNKYYYLTYIITLIIKIFNTYNRTIIILILKYKNIIMILIINGVSDGSNYFNYRLCSKLITIIVLYQIINVFH